LKGVRLFQSLAPDQVAALEAACAFKRAPAKTWIVDQKAGGTDVFFVVQGHVRAIVTTAGVDTILADIHDGDFFGELAAIDQQPRSAGILAISDAALAVMSAAAFRRALHTYEDVCDQVLLRLVGQVRALDARIDERSSLEFKPRLWGELLRMARPSALAGGGLVVSPPPTHAEMAARVGGHREAVTREFGVLERAGLIERRRGAIALPHPERLRAMVEAASQG
jgi:CRP-like cAMP-binding protein